MTEWRTVEMTIHRKLGESRTPDRKLTRDELRQKAALHLEAAQCWNDVASNARSQMRHYMRTIPKWEWVLESDIHCWQRSSAERQLVNDRKRLDMLLGHVREADANAELALRAARRLQRRAARPSWRSFWDGVLEVLWPLIIVRAVLSGRKP